MISIDNLPPLEVQMHEAQEMYRAVILGAIKDVGYGKPKEVEDVSEWLDTHAFTTCCDLANWESDWVRQILTSSILLTGRARKPIVKETMEMLRIVMRVTKDDLRGLPVEDRGVTHPNARISDMEIRLVESEEEPTAGELGKASIQPRPRRNSGFGYRR